METKKRALGRGLEQLFNSENLDLDTFEKQVYKETPKNSVVEIKLDDIRPNPHQPRKVFNQDALKELSESIKQNGVFQPIIVKKSIKGYDLIAGERRFRASKLAGKDTIPAIVRDLTEEQMIEIAVLENLQREDLNVIEEALAYKSMIDKLNLTQEELSIKVSKSRSHITNILGLLRLPKEIQKMLINGDLTMSHARILSKFDNEEKMLEYAKQIVENKLPVHEVEEMTIKEPKKNQIKHKEENKDLKYVEDLLRDKLDTKVKVRENKLVINYTNIADLNRILEILNIGE